MLMYLSVVYQTAEAQILKGFGEKLEKKIEQRIERKADRQVDKLLDKAEKKADEPIDDIMNKSTSEKDVKKENTLSKKQPAFEIVVAQPEQELTLLGNCTDFTWFEKGAVLVYEAFDNRGRSEATNRMEILEVSSKGSAKVAKVKASMSTPQFGNLDYEMSYVCDGDKIYMDVGAMMKALMKNNPDMKNTQVQEAMKNVDINFDNGFASFPKKMYPGMELDNLNFSFKTKAASGEMSFHVLVTDRQVVSREQVTTQAGTFDCLKIRSVTNSSMNIMGMNQTIPPSTEYLWISPKIGVIKQETHTNKEVSSMLLKTYKL